MTFFMLIESAAVHSSDCASDLMSLQSAMVWHHVCSFRSACPQARHRERRAPRQTFQPRTAGADTVVTGKNNEAARFYRMLMKSDPTDPSASFNLGNMLRTTAMSKLRQHSGPRREPIRHLRRLGTILVTYWTSRDGRKSPLNACARRCGSSLTTLMRCSISRCCFNE